MEVFAEEVTNTKYWLDVFERFAATIGRGFSYFMIELLNNLSIQENMILNELNFEVNTFVPS